MLFILFSSPVNFEEEITLVNHFLLDKELVFHIRKPSLSFKELRGYIQKIPTEHHNQLVIHQHIELLKEFELRGFHCTRYFLENSKETLTQLKLGFPNFTFSKSCHTLSELDGIDNYDYVFLSPIFNSISKEDYHSSLNVIEANKTIKKIKIPIYALGGISSKNIAQLRNTHFKGIGVLGFIWNSITPIENYNKLKKELY